MRTGPTNQELRNLIVELKKASITNKVGLWKRLAIDLEKPTRSRRVVNLTRIDRNSNKNELVVVPGKVLGAGEITKSVIVAAWQFSGQAREKIIKAKGDCMSLQELLAKKPKLSEVRILG
jgi:large subunit ribosomal protein L18e